MSVSIEYGSIPPRTLRRRALQMLRQVGGRTLSLALNALARPTLVWR